MAILDTAGYIKVTEDVNDDRLAFLEAVRSASIVPENGSAPTNTMFEAIFQILKDEDSLELIMASYQLLIKLDKRFPRVYLSSKGKSELESPSTAPVEVVVVQEAWSPFSDACSGREEADKNSGRSLDPVGFHLLIQDLAKVADEAKSEASESKLLRNMLLLQYLVRVLEGDFIPRNSAFKSIISFCNFLCLQIALLAPVENTNWPLLRESLLNMLLGSRKIIYKGIIKDCLSVTCEMSQFHTESGDDMRGPEKASCILNGYGSAIAIALPEVEKCTCTAIQNLLLMIMDLDASKKIADLQGLTSRADSVRTLTAEIILDELTYNIDLLSPFFQVFGEPKWKLEIILQYFRKYIAKDKDTERRSDKMPSFCTRRSSGSADDTTFHGILKSFSDSSSTKSIIKKISGEVAQILLAHAFQAYLSLLSRHSVEGVCGSGEGVQDSSLVEVCKNMIAAFTCLKRTDVHTEILPLGKEALFTAATILATKS
ncbi:hypothetical protein RJ639_010014 [Escallonia herrerae]|uniref:Negative regulator of systemic acquired resistance SNI1 n=1 Tax=Escallonia herrerae TaxID=1293975 RepID=A0AA89AR01_9ASTE|nr:hypothetical protein RJ639_010014 [Escallonia herrerae]